MAPLKQRRGQARPAGTGPVCAAYGGGPARALPVATPHWKGRANSVLTSTTFPPATEQAASFASCFAATSAATAQGSPEARPRAASAAARAARSAADAARDAITPACARKSRPRSIAITTAPSPRASTVPAPRSLRVFTNTFFTGCPLLPALTQMLSASKG